MGKYLSFRKSIILVRTKYLGIFSALTDEFLLRICKFNVYTNKIVKLNLVLKN